MLLWQEEDSQGNCKDRKVSCKTAKLQARLGLRWAALPYTDCWILFNKCTTVVYRGRQIFTWEKFTSGTIFTLLKVIVHLIGLAQNRSGFQHSSYLSAIFVTSLHRWVWFHFFLPTYSDTIAQFVEVHQPEAVLKIACIDQAFSPTANMPGRYLWVFSNLGLPKVTRVEYTADHRLE